MDDINKIFHAYLFPWMIIDIIAVFPQKYVTSEKKIWGINKLIKVPRLFFLYQQEKIIENTANFNHYPFIKKIYLKILNDNVSQFFLTFLYWFSYNFLKESKIQN